MKSFSISLSPLSLLNSALPNGLQGTAYNLTLNATGGVTPYTWRVNGGALPSGLTLNSATGAISGTPTGSGSTDFTIQVVDSESPVVMLSQTYSITIEPTGGVCGAPGGKESMLSGNYAFMVQGFEGGNSGTPVAIAASFSANGAGQVTGGDIDVSEVNDATGSDTHYTIAPYATASPVSLYTVSPGPSAGYLGCVMLTTSVGTTMSFRFSLGGISGGIASNGKIIEFDDASASSGTVAAGIMALQAPSSSIGSAYAFGLDGETLTGQPFAAAGSFSVASSGGAISNAAVDVNTAGANSGALSGGSGSLAAATSDGRRTLNFSVGTSGFSWIVYVVSSKEAYVVSTAFPAAGRMLSTSSNLTQSTLSGNYVAYSTGACSGTSCSDVNLGLLNLTSGTVSGPVWDYNLSSSAPGTPTNVSGVTYSVSSSSGRVTFSQNVGSNGLISYLVSPAVEGISGITVGTDAAAHFGYMAAQTAVALPGGQFVYGTVDPRYNSVVTYAGTATITPGGTSNFNGTENESGQSSGLLSGVSASRTVTLGGNGTGSASSAGGNSIAVTDGAKLYWFDYGDGVPPVITVADPQ